MGTRLLVPILIAVILSIAAPASAAWVLQPTEGYDCPPGFTMEVISSSDGVLDICVAEEAPPAPAMNDAEDPSDQTAHGPEGEEEIEETVRM